MDKPEDVIDRWRAGWNASDADALAALFAEDAEFVNVVGLWWHNREAIRQSHAFGFEKIFAGSTMRFNKPRIRMLSADAAVVHARWHVVGQRTPEGGLAGPREGIFVFVLNRVDGAWTVVTAQNTDVIRGVQTHVTTDSGRGTLYYGDPTV